MTLSTINSQAEELNKTINTTSPAIFEMLSKRGKAIYFPRKGILAQGAAARDKEINATIGTAYENDGKPMILPSIAQSINMDAKDVFPYAPSEGIKPLRDKWQELIRAKNPSLGKHEISTPVVTCGVTNALSIVGYLFTGEEDTVIMPDLYWENYDLVFTNAYGAELKFFNLFRNHNFDVHSFREALNNGKHGKKIVLLNFPNNPSGYTPTKEVAQSIIHALREAAAEGNKILVITDDSYFGLCFENDIYRESLFAELAGCHPNLLAVKVDGITKEEYAWGLRIGFITYGIKGGTKELYKALEDKTAGAIRGNISNSSHMAQTIFLKAIQSEAHEKEKQINQQKINERYLKVKDVLKAHQEYSEYFEALPFNSGYFMCVGLNKSLNAEKIWDVLLKKYSTGVICYADNNLFRIAFASTPTAKIEKLFANLYAACKENN